MFQDIVIPLIAIAVAELGDKTQLAVICLSGKTKRYWLLFLGAMSAFALTDGLAVLLGGVLSASLPETWVKLAAGILFVGFGVFELFKKLEDEGSCELKSPFLSAFTLIFLAELGDKTQLASALFGARFSPGFVFLGVMIAMALLTIAGIFLGRMISARLDKRKMSYFSGWLFILIGAWTLAALIFIHPL